MLIQYSCLTYSWFKQAQTKLAAPPDFQVIKYIEPLRKPSLHEEGLWRRLQNTECFEFSFSVISL